MQTTIQLGPHFQLRPPTRWVWRWRWLFGVVFASPFRYRRRREVVVGPRRELLEVADVPHGPFLPPRPPTPCRRPSCMLRSFLGTSSWVEIRTLCQLHTRVQCYSTGYVLCDTDQPLPISFPGAHVL